MICRVDLFSDWTLFVSVGDILRSIAVDAIHRRVALSYFYDLSQFGVMKTEILY